MRVKDFGQRLSRGLSRSVVANNNRVEIEFTPRRPVHSPDQPTPPGEVHSVAADQFTDTPRQVGNTIEPQYIQLPTETVINDDITIHGNVRSGKTLIIEGKVEGDIDGKSVVIGLGGDVQGNITASKIVVQGKVRGAVRGETVELCNTADVEGDIIHQGIGIEKGTRFDGVLQWDRNPGEINAPSRQRGKTAAAVDALKQSACASRNVCESHETVITSRK